MISIIIVQAIIVLSLIIQCISFKAELSNRHMRIRICAASAQEIVNEFITLQAMDDLRCFNAELPKEFLSANQSGLSPAFWNKWNDRVRAHK